MKLLWKILLSTSVALTLLLAATAFLVQRNLLDSTSRNLEQEVNVSLRAYESLWNARAEQLRSVSKVLSSMSDVRAAFGTRDQATIRDTAGELWSHISSENAFFLVADPEGRVIASLGSRSGLSSDNLSVVKLAAPQFPRQATGFLEDSGRLFQIVITPVYVQSGVGPALINVLLAGYRVDETVASALKQATGGSEFLFVSGGRVIASTLQPAAAVRLSETLGTGKQVDYASLGSPLLNIEGRPIGNLWILRSFEAVQQKVAQLQKQIVWIWLIALGGGLVLTYVLARRILQPIAALGRAAAEIGRQNYAYRVDVRGTDELARLAQTFNSMSASIQDARQELIRQERITTIGRLSTSIVHDLRSPLAAIYGGAEMLVDSELSEDQVNRLSRNIYRASRQVQQLLQELIDVSRGKTGGAELCRLQEVVLDAWSLVRVGAEKQGVELEMNVPDDLEIHIERGRMERAFLNLMENAVEAMPAGGTVRVVAHRENGQVNVRVEDTGPGIRSEIRERLFQPFVTAGKKNGLGLGLALSRQTLLDNGGDLWLDPDGRTGARFCLRLPAAV